MLGYAKVKPGEKIDDKACAFEAYYCDKVVIDDSRNPKAEGSLWNELKAELLTYDDRQLYIDSIYSLGKTGREIYRELQWIKENKVKLYIINVPGTIVDNYLSNQVIYDVFKDKALRERRNVSDKQMSGQELAHKANVKFGRPVTEYPENWEQDYSLWKDKKIGTVEFMKLSGLKKGTFYNMIKRYKKEFEEAYEETDSAG